VNFVIPGKSGTLVMMCFTFGPVFFVGLGVVEDVGGTDFVTFANFGGFGGVGVVGDFSLDGGVGISAVGGLGPGLMAGVADGRPPRARRISSKSSLSSLTPGSAARGGGSDEGRVAADSDLVQGVAVGGGDGAGPFSSANLLCGRNCGSAIGACRAGDGAIGPVICEL